MRRLPPRMSFSQTTNYDNPEIHKCKKCGKKLSKYVYVRTGRHKWSPIKRSGKRLYCAKCKPDAYVI